MLVQELFLTSTAQQADIVLPAQSFAEREAPLTNYERRVQYFPSSILPRDDCKPDWEILTLLANELDQTWKYGSSAEVFADLAANLPAFRGMSYSQLSGKLIRTRSHFLYEGTSFETSGGQGMVYPSAAENAETRFELKFREPALPAESELLLVGARLLYDDGTLIGETQLLRNVTPSSYADLNHADAERLQIKNGDRIRLKSEFGTLELPAHVDGRAPLGVVVAPINLMPADTRALLPRGRGEITAPVTVEKVAI